MFMRGKLFSHETKFLSLNILSILFLFLTTQPLLHYLQFMCDFSDFMDHCVREIMTRLSMILPWRYQIFICWFIDHFMERHDCPILFEQDGEQEKVHWCRIFYWVYRDTHFYLWAKQEIPIMSFKWCASFFSDVFHVWNQTSWSIWFIHLWLTIFLTFFQHCFLMFSIYSHLRSIRYSILFYWYWTELLELTFFCCIEISISAVSASIRAIFSVGSSLSAEVPCWDWGIISILVMEECSCLFLRLFLRSFCFTIFLQLSRIGIWW